MARKDLSPESVLAIVAKDINPNYKKPGGQMNCRRCSLTYELRRRGYDVTATASSLGYGQSESGLINAILRGEKKVYGAESLSIFVATSEGDGIRKTLFGDRRTNPGAIGKIAFDVVNENVQGHTQTPSVAKLYEKLGKLPNNSRGEAVFDFGQFGHSISWEIFNGKPVFFDTQKGQKFEDIQGFFAKWGAPTSAELTRLDNLDLDLDFLSRWATDRKR